MKELENFRKYTNTSNLGIVKEGAILLTSDERNQIEEIIPKIIDLMSTQPLPVDGEKFIDSIEYVSADKTLGKVNVFVVNKKGDYSGAYYANDKQNPNDNSIVVNQYAFGIYFSSLGRLAFKTQKFLAGDENAAISALRTALKHELIHAKDPALNHHYLKEPYSHKPEVYYKSWAEFQTMTGQFFEAIISGVDKVLSSNPTEKDIEKIENGLNNLLDIFSGKNPNLYQETIDMLQLTGTRNMFQQMTKNIQNNIGLPTNKAATIYFEFLDSIRKYHPESWKEFQKDLYKIIDQAKDKIKASISEMFYINEIKRIEKLYN
jgi:hypothetical protein